MAFMTSTLVNGEWTSRPLDVNAVLRHYDEQDKEASANAVEVERSPVLGLLTQTAIRSPLVHWILPVRLRGLDANDVAFIGDDFIQIRELRLDGHLWDVIQKDNFGARICNACVVGSIKAYSRDHESSIPTQVKDEAEGEDADVEMNAVDGGAAQSRTGSPLPPQAILLQLDTGDSVFLMLRQTQNGDYEFVSTRHRISKTMLTVQPGAHLAVDPSSRYMAIGCSESIFAIYALRSREDLKKQHSQGEPLEFIESERYFYLHGVILKMNFLYPSPDDDQHIILLVLVVYKGKTRMLLYEWAAGSNMREIRSHSRRGHILEKSRQLPLLVIPLTVKSSFILAYEDSMAVCKNILLGSPQIVAFGQVIPPTPSHHGSGMPLWTAWTRPTRLPYHTTHRDDIYLVREDGYVKFLEIDATEEDIIRTDMDVGELGSNSGTALASLDYRAYDANTGDLLITSGDSCVGGTYLVGGRQTPIFIESIPNWSPAQDIVTTSMSQDRDREISTISHPGLEQIPKPDKLFACVGKGSKGSITEFRYGLEARLGLETEFHMPVMDAWVCPSSICMADDSGGSLFLLSLVNRSALLHLSSDAAEIDELDQKSTLLDLRYRTIATSLYGDYKIHVTEQSVVYIVGQNSHTFEGQELLGIYRDGTIVGSAARIDDAVTHGMTALFTVHFQNETYLQMLDFTTPSGLLSSPISTNPGETTRVRTLRKFLPQVTTMAICTIERDPYVIIAEWTGDAVKLTFQPISGGDLRHAQIPATYEGSPIRLEAFVSISASSEAHGSIVLICGTRNGLAVTLHLSGQNLELTGFLCDRIGATPVIIKKVEWMGSKKLVFMICDSKLYSLKVPAIQEPELDFQISSGRRSINQIWLTDMMNPGLQQPGVNSIASLQPNILDGTGSDILLVSGSQLLLASLSTQPKTVPRHLPIGGTPTRLLYSSNLNALIVAASIDGRCTLLFIDPDTGADLSKPVDKKGAPVQFVSGLGEINERVFRLLEWSYMKDGKTWCFIVVSTNTGRLLIISTEKETSLPSMDTNSLEGGISDVPKIRHWTRYKFKCPRPIYSVAGFGEGLIYCSGNTLYYDILNLGEKKFQTVAQYDLPSPAVDLVFEDGKIYAVTAAHSLEMLELGKEANGDSKIIHTHSDQVTRSSLHHRILGTSPGNLIDLISDKSRSVVGLWPTHHTRADTLVPVFEARLPHSILRFRSANCRPIWDPAWQSSTKSDILNHGLVRNSTGYPEVLGLSIDGSLYHFTVLGSAPWKFLRFLVNLAMQSPKICEFTYTKGEFSLEPASEPKSMMHVDGDILRRVLAGGLPDLLGIGQRTEEARQIQEKFCELLRELHGGNLDRGAGMDVCVKRAYRDLEFFLRPVL